MENAQIQGGAHPRMTFYKFWLFRERRNRFRAHVVRIKKELL